MDSSSIIALVGVVVAALIAILGGFIRYLLNKLGTAEAVNAVKDQTIAAQQRQIDRLEVSALIQDKLFGTRTPDPGSYQPPTRGA
jgi:hypothetical protein